MYLGVPFISMHIYYLSKKKKKIMKRWDLECVDGCLVSKQRVKHDIKKDKTLGNHT